jgi:hypothetical protein
VIVVIVGFLLLSVGFVIGVAAGGRRQRELDMLLLDGLLTAANAVERRTPPDSLPTFGQQLSTRGAPPPPRDPA